MATDAIPTQTFLIRGLKTRSVTLYPNKAQVIRDISGISLEPGANQIIIEGLTPTIDEHSIKVDGTGSATITDLSVQLVANKEDYDDVYPEDDVESDVDDEIDAEEVQSEAVIAIIEKIDKLNSSLEDQNEIIASSTARLALLEQYGNTIGTERPEDLAKFIKDYRDERVRVFTEHKSASTQIDEIKKEIKSHNKDKTNLERASNKAKLKAEQEKRKALEKRWRKENEARKEKERIKTERSKFWPKKVYKLIISIEAPTGFTPSSSRRGSMDSLVKIPSPADLGDSASDPAKITDINLSLSYITYSASWSPRYDLNVHSVTNSAILDYGAELTNTTSETWRDAKIILSTSQTSYQGLGDTIPVLVPWSVRLAKNNQGFIATDAGLYSKNEQSQKMLMKNKVPPQLHTSRNALFGFDNTPQAFGGPARPMPPAMAIPPPPPAPTIRSQMVQQMPSGVHAGTLPSTGSLFGGPGASFVPVAGRSGPSAFGAFGGSSTNAISGGLFGNQSSMSSNPFGAAAPPMASRSRGLFSEARKKSSDEVAASYDFDSESAAEGGDGDGRTFVTPDPVLLFEESSFEESGMTTTYDLPNLKTLPPTSTSTKHKIARIDFKGIVFSHILIPKLKEAAFLKARLRNSSKITLLKGPAGLTLDGSFLGQSSIPRCSAGDAFSLPLGVDPTINVSYTKPTVRRSQSGIFNKEDCEVFTRTAIVTNTKHNAPVEVQVLDQIPVSEDERLKIEIVTPRGLRVGGDGVIAGVGMVNNDSKASAASNARLSVYGDDGTKAAAAGNDGKWGSAVATAKKGGEVNWNVKINPLRGCKLVLEYEATFPGGETVVAVN